MYSVFITVQAEKNAHTGYKWFNNTTVFIVLF